MGDRRLSKIAVSCPKLGNHRLSNGGLGRQRLLAQRGDLGRAKAAVSAGSPKCLKLAVRCPLPEGGSVHAEQLAGVPNRNPFWSQRGGRSHRHLPTAKI